MICGTGICQVSVDECVNGQPNACVPGDPNPTGESCDGFDDDCDGLVDEDCRCTDGHTQSCYTGNPATQNVGECHDGMQTCSAGEWGACTDAVTPINELCDSLDNDCNGVVDDGNPGGGANCDTGFVGVCAAGTENCVSGQLTCAQNVQPSPELCNGLDDDCNATTIDGSADPAVGVACDGPDQDLCEEGPTTCSNGNPTCEDNTGNVLDVCDGLDNDCDSSSLDGSEDSQIGVACDGADTDACIEGAMTCPAGGLVCGDNTSSTTELCTDNVDNDCDSLTNEFCCDTVAGPMLVDGVTGWPNSGLQFTALITGTLELFVFENQGFADISRFSTRQRTPWSARSTYPRFRPRSSPSTFLGHW